MKTKRALFIGGTGTISAAITRALLAGGQWELWHVNRGIRDEAGFEGAKRIICDVNDEDRLKTLLGDTEFDAVADFIAFVPRQLERDFRLFSGRTKQFIFISSASAYQKPLSRSVIDESTPLINPYWEYSRNKIACEDYLSRQYREHDFPITIIRPSHTYDERSVPLGVHGSSGSWQVVKRVSEGRSVIIHGDGLTLWTLTHNTDFAKGFIGLMGNKHAIGEAVGITGDEALTWRQIYEIIADYFDKPLNAVYVPSDFLHAAACGRYDFLGGLIGDKANTAVFDTSKLKRLVPGFAATKRADDGIREALDYITAHKECQTEDPEFDAWSDKVIAAIKSAQDSLTAPR